MTPAHFAFAAFCPDVDVLAVSCPLCSYVGLESGNGGSGHYERDDYATHEMLWCDGCSARMVTGFPQRGPSEPYYEPVDEKDVPDDIKMRLVGCLFGGGRAGEDMCFAKIPFLKIRRIINHQLAKYEHPSPSQELLRSFISSGFFGHGFAERDALQKKPGQRVAEVDFDMGVEIDSYDANDAKAYGLDMRHDGKYIYLLCEDSGGNAVRACYWGD